MRASDLNFVYSSWKRGLRFGNDFFRKIDADSFYEAYTLIINALITRADCKVTVACLKDDEDVVLGYSVVRGDILDWLFVKQSWRGFGIAKQLCSGSELKACSHITNVGDSIRKKKGLIFNPYL